MGDIEMRMPDWWIWVSGIYFVFSILWTIGLCVGTWMLYQKTVPVLREARIQVRRVSDQAKTIAVKASNTAEIVHVQARNLLGNAQGAGNQVARSARTAGAAFTGLIVAARVVSFLRRIL